MNIYDPCFSQTISLLILSLSLGFVAGKLHLDSKLLCNQCSECDIASCPASESYPHMTAFDNSLIAGALQSDFVDLRDRGIYSVPLGNVTGKFNSVYYGWESSSGSTSGYHRFRNYMDRCSGGKRYLTVNSHEKVTLSSLKSLQSLVEADWKSINPPKKLNHQSVRFWVSGSTGKCLTVIGEKGEKKGLEWRSVGLMGLTLSSCSHFGSIIITPSAVAAFTTIDFVEL